MTVAAPSRATAALAQRLRAVRAVLGVPDPAATPGQTVPFQELVGLVTALREQPADAASWLLVVGLTGAMPDRPLVRSVTRVLALREPEECVRWLLDALQPLVKHDGNAEATLRVVRDRPLVDVNFTARSDFLTGIQRVVRGVVSEWNRREDIEIVAWSDRGGAFRSLSEAERARVTQREVPRYDQHHETAITAAPEVVVPWGVPVVLLEVPPEAHSERLAALAELTETSVRLVGYDCIPVSSAETVPLAETEKFGRYLELVKHADRVAGISQTAAREFAGFARALTAQGLVGPEVGACPLPHTVPLPAEPEPVERSDRALVTCIGTVGTRKNQLALLQAAEMLWREGLEFEVRLLGHVAREDSPLEGVLDDLRALGRPVSVEAGVSDRRIATTLAQARCLVFPTLHEGFGLPIVEALSHGVPVITSDFGSTREVVQDQGGLLVDPTDIDALGEALRAVLTDDDLHARLVAEAHARPVRTWTDYAEDLWGALLG